jgi:hypothetical protein
MENSYDQREHEFAHDYLFDNFCGADDLGKLILHAAERLAALCLDDIAVDGAMKALHEALGLPGFRADHEGDRSWRMLWAESGGSEFELLPLGQTLTSLNAYAYWGLSPNASVGACSIDDIKAVAGLVKAAVGSPGGDRPKTPDIDRVILAAEGRLALDEGRPITLEQLSALTRISMKSIRNAAAPSSGSGLNVKDGAVTADSALKWLTARGDFKTSIWSQADETELLGETVHDIEGEILWVPFASDGSEFHPESCLRGGGYSVGRKGAEEKIEDYRKALDRLAKMRPAQYWRRPNTAGNWGIVTAEGFRPRTAEELGLASKEGDNK